MSTTPTSTSTTPSSSSSSYRVLCSSASAWEKDEQVKQCRICQRVHFLTASWFPTTTASKHKPDHPVDESVAKMIGRRHHCRRCGQVVCNLCAHFSLPYSSGSGSPSYHRTCIHCVIWFEVHNISSQKVANITTEVKQSLRHVNLLLEGDMVNIQQHEDLIRMILHISNEDEKRLPLPLFLPHVATSTANSTHTSDSLTCQQLYIIPLSDFIHKYFLYPYVTKLYGIYLFHLQRDLVQYHQHRYVSYDAMVRGHIYPHSYATLRLLLLASCHLCVDSISLPQVANSFLKHADGSIAWEDNVVQLIREGADVHHRLHLRNTNYSLLTLLQHDNMLHGVTQSRHRIDWRWVNFYNVREYYHMSTSHSINVDHILQAADHPRDNPRTASKAPLLITPDRSQSNVAAGECSPISTNSDIATPSPASKALPRIDIHPANEKKKAKKTFSWSNMLIGRNTSTENQQQTDIPLTKHNSWLTYETTPASETLSALSRKSSQQSINSQLGITEEVDDSEGEEEGDDEIVYSVTDRMSLEMHKQDKEDLHSRCSTATNDADDGIFQTVGDSEEYLESLSSFTTAEADFTMEEYDHNYYVWKPRPSVSSANILDKISTMSPLRIEAIRSNVGTNVLHLAVAAGNSTVVRMLLGGRKDLAITSTKYKRAVQYLRHKIHNENEEGLSPISVAQMLHQTIDASSSNTVQDDMVSILIKYGK